MCDLSEGVSQCVIVLRVWDEGNSRAATPLPSFPMFIHGKLGSSARGSIARGDYWPLVRGHGTAMGTPYYHRNITFPRTRDFESLQFR